MMDEEHIKIRIQHCWEEIDRIRANRDLIYPEMHIWPVKSQIAALYWVLDDPDYDVADVYK